MSESGGDMPSRRVGGLLPMALMAAIGSLAVHMLVPALPLVARDLQADEPTIQLTVTLYLVGLGIGQLVAGPVADRLGRRPVLLAGLIVCLAGLLISFGASDATVLIVGRVVTALGGAAAIVSVRAMVADSAAGADATAQLAILTSVVLLSPTLSPVIGGALADAGGWRLIFACLASCAAALIVIAWRRLPETHLQGGARRSPVHDFAQLLGTARFLRFAVAVALSRCALYLFLSASPFLLTERWGLTPSEAGFCCLLVAAAGVGGTLIVRRLRSGGAGFRVGLALAVAGSALMLALGLAGFDGPMTLIAPMIIVGLGTGIAAPAGIAGVMQCVPGLAATSTSLAGALQMVISGAAATIATQMHIAKPSWLAAAILAAAAAAFLAAPTDED